MDKMEEWELLEFFDVLDYSEYISWEQTRLLLSCHADRKKVKKLTDIIEFPWDNENGNIETQKRISNEDINRLKELSKVYIKTLNIK